MASLTRALLSVRVTPLSKCVKRKSFSTVLGAEVPDPSTAPSSISHCVAPSGPPQSNMARPNAITVPSGRGLDWEKGRSWGEEKGKRPEEDRREERGERAGEVIREFEWMARHTHGFPVDGSRVQVLDQPQEFYNTLKTLCEGARKRIIIASLYLGTGSLEQDLVESIRVATARSLSEGGNLHVKFLLDYMRGSRGDSAGGAGSSRTMLLGLLHEFGSFYEESGSGDVEFGSSHEKSGSSRADGCGRVGVALYHSPDVRGAVKRVLPERFNETVGLSHVKCYIADDTLVMSGANLSESYFTNRQDRYVRISDCRALCDYYERLVSAVSALCFQLQPDNTVRLSDRLHCHPFKDMDGGAKYRSLMKQRVEQVILPRPPPAHPTDPLLTPFHPPAASLQSLHRLGASGVQRGATDHSSGAIEAPRGALEAPNDTVVYPLVQMGPFGIVQDEGVTRALLRGAGGGSTLHLATGYFNLTDEYARCVVSDCSAAVEILTAAPEANGFYGSRGISGAIPDAYTYIACQFCAAVTRAGQRHRVRVWEYVRPGWTVHSKGLWYCRGGADPRPSLTMIGSPNFGYRSVYRDLESQLVIVTENDALRQQLHEERLRLYEGSTLVTDGTFELPERRIPLWVSIVTPFIKTFF